MAGVIPSTSSARAALDEPTLRERLEEWDDDMRVVVPVELLRGLVGAVDRARASAVADRALADAARDAVVVWGGAVVDIARALGVVITTGDSVEVITGKVLSEVASIRRRLLIADVDAAEHRATRGLLEALFGGALR
jgi:hypothetical protein